jgi:hypothetical protein
LEPHDSLHWNTAREKENQLEKKIENEKGRYSEADKRGGFRVRDPQGSCYGFTNNPQHADFSRSPSPFLSALFILLPPSPLRSYI